MNKPLSVMQQVRACIEEQPLGKPFTPAMLLAYGSRAAVDQVLSRLRKTGFIERIGRGIYVRPEISRFVGKVMPEAAQLAQVMAEQTGAVIAVHGAEAARRLGLTTQMPTQSVFMTSGPSRSMHIGNLQIRLKHVSQRKLALAGRPAGLALSALWYLGPHEVVPETIAALQKRLPEKEFMKLNQSRSSMPAWMSDMFSRYEQAGSLNA